MNRAYNKNNFWRDREHQSLHKLNFIPKNEKSSYSPKLCLIYYTCQSFELKATATETNSAGFEETRNFWRLIALTSKTC